MGGLTCRDPSTSSGQAQGQPRDPQGLKPNSFPRHFAARLKSCPDTSASPIEFFCKQIEFFCKLIEFFCKLIEFFRKLIEFFCKL